MLVAHQYIITALEYVNGVLLFKLAVRNRFQAVENTGLILKDGENFKFLMLNRVKGISNYMDKALA